MVNGWRWYRVDGNRLVSPLVGRIALPRNGVLENAYFIPRAGDMWSVAMMIAGQRWYSFALTFGVAQGPFSPDPTMRGWLPEIDRLPSAYDPGHGT